MIDPLLNRQLENCKKLLIYWRKFHEYLDRVIKGGEFNQQDEADFLKLKSNIAILHDSLLDTIENTKENMATAQSVISLVERCILLRQVAKMNAAEIKKMQIEWHESYLLINETIGLIQDRIDSLAKVSYIAHVTKRSTDTVVSSLTRALTNKTFHFFLGLTVFLGITVGMPMMGVFSYDFLNKTPMTASIYASTRAMLRSSVMKDLEFQEWLQYSWEQYNIEGVKHYRKPMPQGFQPRNNPAPSPNEMASVETSFLTKNYADIAPLDIKALVSGEKIEKPYNIECYNKDGQNVYVFLVMFKKASDASAAEATINDWRSKIPETSNAKNIEDRVLVGRVSNFLYMIYAENKEFRDAVDLTMHGKEGK